MLNFKNVAIHQAEITPIKDKEQLAQAFESVMKIAYCEALMDYGIWKDGSQTIGCLNEKVTDIIDGILNDYELKK